MQTLTRRQLLKAAGAGAAALTLAPMALFAAEKKKAGYSLPALPYGYDALEPYIDAETMHLHHDFHHKAYVDNLNKALAAHEDLQSKPIEELLRDIDNVPKDIRQAVINHGGGHANHSMFWVIMAKNPGGKPSGALAKSIDDTFGSFDKFQQQLSEVAVKRFGSGWGWLVMDKGKLAVVSSSNQDSPLMIGQYPVMGIDVWEHAYYLKYKNRRPEYVKAWWNVVNWENVNERFEQATKQG